jgi:hypothetical protein
MATTPQDILSPSPAPQSDRPYATARYKPDEGHGGWILLRLILIALSAAAVFVLI